jgi:hypothetical protein
MFPSIIQAQTKKYKHQIQTRPTFLGPGVIVPPTKQCASAEQTMRIPRPHNHGIVRFYSRKNSDVNGEM